MKRYQSWAGTGWPRGFENMGIESVTGIVWPIVDNETCGEIDGYPTAEQWFCVAFDFKAQGVICDALNGAAEKEQS